MAVSIKADKIVNSNLEEFSFFFTDLQEGQGLVFNEATQRWENADVAVNGLDGSSESKAAPNATYLKDLGKTSGQYWIKPEDVSNAYLCDVLINITDGVGAGASYVKVTGMASNYSRYGLSAMGSGASNTSYLSNNSHKNSEGYNYKVDDDFINNFGATRMMIQSTSETMTAAFNRSGSYVTCPNLRSYYYNVNQKSANAAIVGVWIDTHVNIFDAHRTQTDAELASNGAILWPGNDHYGWSTSASQYNHMLHGAENTTPYTGFCLGSTCWNESAAIWLSVDE